MNLATKRILLFILGASLFHLSPPVGASDPIPWEGPVAEAFALPFGKGTGEGYHVFRKAFDELPGETWDGVGGGDTDLGNPVSTIGDGLVIFSGDSESKWGNMVIVRHAYRDERGEIVLIDSIYAYLFEVFVRTGDEVSLGDPIGAIGRAKKEGNTALLYFAIRKCVDHSTQNIEPEQYRRYYHDPREFIAMFTSAE